MASDIDVAWAAGLFEGEGSLYVSCMGQARLAMEMTDEDVIRRFATIIGRGNVRAYERRGVRKPGSNYKPVWQWSIQSADGILDVVPRLSPFFGTRRSIQAEIVLQRAQEIAAARGHCRRGHDLSDPKHLYVHRKTGKGHCRTCRLDYSRSRPRPVG